VERQAEQPLLVAAVDLVGQDEELLLVAGARLVGEGPDPGPVLLDDEQQVAAVAGIGQDDRPVEPEVREGDLGGQRRQGRGRGGRHPRDVRGAGAGRRQDGRDAEAQDDEPRRAGAADDGK
jgi:IS5 family transposase